MRDNDLNLLWDEIFSFEFSHIIIIITMMMMIMIIMMMMIPGMT